MDVFNGFRFVRLRSIVRADKYVAADVDGEGVCLTRQRAVHNTVWAVDHALGPDGSCVLLRGAYGRYLCAADFRGPAGPSHAVDAGQVNFAWNNPPPSAMRWVPIRRRGFFVVRCSLGCYLRANGRLRRWRRDVTVARDDGSTMMLWTIEGVPLRVPRPNLIFTEDVQQLRHRHRPPPTEREVTRDIRYVRCGPNGNIDDAAWRTVQVRTNSNMELWRSVAQHWGPGHGLMDSTLCTRAGTYGRFTPLQVDLPVGNDTIHIVIVVHGTPAHQALSYADLNAPPPLPL